MIPTNYTITIDIPAIQALANAINRHTDQMPVVLGGLQYFPLTEEQIKDRLTRLVGPKLAEDFMPTPVGSASGSCTGAQDGIVAPAEKPARKPREKKATDDPKQVEETIGRRVELNESVPVPADKVADEPTPSDPIKHQWTLEELIDTFAKPIQPENDSAEAKAACNALRADLKQTMKDKVDPEYASLTTLKPEMYDAFAAVAIGWYKAKGLTLNLPEGVEA